MARINFRNLETVEKPKPTYETLDGEVIELGFEGFVPTEIHQESDSLEADLAVLDVIASRNNDDSEAGVFLGEKRISSEGFMDKIKAILEWIKETLSKWWDRLFGKESKSDKGDKKAEEASTLLEKLSKVPAKEGWSLDYKQSLMTNLAAVLLTGEKRGELTPKLMKENALKTAKAATRFCATIKGISNFLKANLSKEGEMEREGFIDEFHQKLVNSFTNEEKIKAGDRTAIVTPTRTLGLAYEQKDGKYEFTVVRDKDLDDVFEGTNATRWKDDEEVKTRIQEIEAKEKENAERREAERIDWKSVAEELKTASDNLTNVMKEWVYNKTAFESACEKLEKKLKDQTDAPPHIAKQLNATVAILMKLTDLFVTEKVSVQLAFHGIVNALKVGQKLKPEDVTQESFFDNKVFESLEQEFNAIDIDKVESGVSVEHHWVNGRFQTVTVSTEGFLDAIGDFFKKIFEWIAKALRAIFGLKENSDGQSKVMKEKAKELTQRFKNILPEIQEMNDPEEIGVLLYLLVQGGAIAYFHQNGRAARSHNDILSGFQKELSSRSNMVLAISKGMIDIKETVKPLQDKDVSFVSGLVGAQGETKDKSFEIHKQIGNINKTVFDHLPNVNGGKGILADTEYVDGGKYDLHGSLISVSGMSALTITRSEDLETDVELNVVKFGNPDEIPNLKIALLNHEKVVATEENIPDYIYGFSNIFKEMDKPLDGLIKVEDNANDLLELLESFDPSNWKVREGYQIRDSESNDETIKVFRDSLKLLAKEVVNLGKISKFIKEDLYKLLKQGEKAIARMEAELTS